MFANRVPGVSLTHWGRVTHMCVGYLTIIGSNNSLSPGRRQAIISTNAGILLIWPFGTNCSEILIKIHTFSFTKIHLKMSSGKLRPFCFGLNVLDCNNCLFVVIYTYTAWYNWTISMTNDDVMTWTLFPSYWSFVMGITSQRASNYTASIFPCS